MKRKYDNYIEVPGWIPWFIFAYSYVLGAVSWAC